MSGTPVVNNLMEAQSLVELVTGHDAPHLETEPSSENCMVMYQDLTILGLRKKPRYAIALREHPLPVDCTSWLPRIRTLNKKSMDVWASSRF